MDTQTEMQMGHSNKKNNLMVGLLGGLSVVTTVAAVAFAVLYFNKPVAKYETIVSDVGSEIKEIITNPDGTVEEIVKPEAAEISDEYIYIPEWGIKLKKPDNFGQMSYTLITGRAEESFFITGIIHDTSLFSFQYVPEFVDIENGSLGALVRVEGAESDESVFSVDGYSFKYVHPQAVLSYDESERAIEKATVEAIETMFTTGISEI